MPSDKNGDYDEDDNKIQSKSKIDRSKIKNYHQ